MIVVNVSQVVLSLCAKANKGSKAINKNCFLKRVVFYKMALYYDLPVYRDTYKLILIIFECTKDFAKEYKRHEILRIVFSELYISEKTLTYQLNIDFKWLENRLKHSGARERT